MHPTRTILIVDDQPDTREAIRLLLGSYGYAVDAVGTGSEALARAAQQPYDLVITDNSMPEMSGEELARAVKERHPGLRVLMFSGYPPDHPMPAVDEVLRKPCDIPALRETVQNLVNGSAEPSGETSV
jgi:CheY-like chemotaxis protein